jgi:hypothetical protein
MAYYNQNQTKQTNSLGMNQEDDAQQQQQAGAAPVQLTTASADNSTPASAPAVPKPAASGMAPGFQAYTRANQGTATNKLTNAAQSNVQNLGQQAQTSINQATNQFGKRVDAGSLANRQQAVQDVANAVSSARNISALPKAAPAAPAQQPQAGLAQETTGTPNLTKAPAAAAPAASNNPLSSLDQSQVNRFQDVINAKYQGPESLRQSGLFNPAAQKTDAANQAVNNASTAQGREELLRQMYQQRGDYTQGLNKLDTAILNSSKAGVQNLQNTANQYKNVSNDLNKAQINSSNLAQNRTQEIQNIQNQARDTFTQGKTAEEQATDSRLNDVTANWDKLPQYFKDLISNKGTANTQILNDQIADYSKSHQAPDANAVAQAQKAIRDADQFYGGINSGLMSDYQKTKAHQQALADAHSKYDSIINAQNDYDSGLNSLKSNFNNNQVALNSQEAGILGLNSGEGLYNLGADAIKTTAADKERLISRDEQARQAALASLAGLDKSNQLDTSLKYSNADKAGTQTATDALDVAGTRAGITEAEKNFGNFVNDTTLTGNGVKKNKTNGKRYYATDSANLGNLLSNAGYTPGQATNQNLNNDVLNRMADAASTRLDGDPKGLGGAVSGAASGYLDPITNMGDGQSLGQNALDIYGTGTGINLITGALGMGSLGNAVGGLFGFGGANTGESKADAAGFARQDLQNKIKSTLDSQGFQNRVAVQNNNTTNSRQQALQQLLANLDKTNRQG